MKTAAHKSLDIAAARRVLPPVLMHSQRRPLTSCAQPFCKKLAQYFFFGRFIVRGYAVAQIK